MNLTLTIAPIPNPIEMNRGSDMDSMHAPGPIPNPIEVNRGSLILCLSLALAYLPNPIQVNRGFDIDEITSTLPPSLKSEV